MPYLQFGVFAASFALLRHQMKKSCKELHAEPDILKKYEFLIEINTCKVMQEIKKKHTLLTHSTFSTSGKLTCEQQCK